MEESATKMLLPLVFAQGEKLFYGKKRKSTENIFQILGTFSEKRKRSRRERIIGYVNVIGRYLGDDFKSHFRMTRTSMDNLISLIGDPMKKSSVLRRRPQEDVRVQCLIAVWVLANQECYRSIADRFNVAKSTVFQFLSRVCDVLNQLAKSIIKWPTEQEALGVIDGFKKKRMFPGVIGAIDGCHVEIKPPKNNAAVYINRKGRASMILQGVCDDKCQFIDIFVGFPGSVHDARVFQKSGMMERCNQDEDFPQNSHLLGDSAYPLGKHILVPFKDNGHLTRKQIKYNVAHAATRVTIERTFGMLKTRWRRLKYLEMHKSCHIPGTIAATCVLHNFCNDMKEVIEEVLEPDDNMNEEFPVDMVQRTNVEKRNNIMNQFL